MIKSFKHKGLKEFFETGKTKGIQAGHAKKLQLILTLLNVAKSAKNMNAPAFGLHELSGSRKGIWSVRVNGNWRVTFRFASDNAEIVDYEDYH